MFSVNSQVPFIVGIFCCVAAVGSALSHSTLFRLRRTKWLQQDQIEEWLEKYDTILFDCDGVIWRGDIEISGVPDTITALIRMGKKVLFVSNNASKHRSAYLSKFKAMGLDISMDQVVTSAFGAARYIVDEYGEGTKVFCVGTEGLKQEMTEAGAEVVDPYYAHDTSSSTSGPAIVRDGVDTEIKVVVGAADWNLSHRKLSYATMCLNTIPGCVLVATNRDKLFPASDGNQYPGAGAAVAALEYCASTKAVDIGKPGPRLLDILAKSKGMVKSRALMVGDRLDTDIAFGRRGGVDTLLVLTGCTTTRRQADEAAYSMVPHYGLESFADIGNALRILKPHKQARRCSTTLPHDVDS